MAKHSYDFNCQVVKEYLSGVGGRRNLSRKYGVVDMTQIRTWIRTYNKYGYEGLKRQKNKKYSFDFKVNIIELYLSGNYTMTELGDKYGVMSTGLISSWVKQYNQFGKSALLPKKRGRKAVMKRKQSKLNEEEKTEYIKK